MPMTTAQFPDLKDAGVLITGGGSGIGASLVEAFAMQGAKVAFIDIAEEPSEALVRRLSGVSPHPVHFFRADLRDVAAIAVTVTEAAAAIGGIKVLVNNAAWDDRHDIDTVTEAYWDANQAVNLKQMFLPFRPRFPTSGSRKTPPSSISRPSRFCSTWANFPPMRRRRQVSSG